MINNGWSFFLFYICSFLVFILISRSGLSQDIEESLEESKLLDMSIEELLNLEITSVSRKREKISDAAAAIYVITSDDIRRMGVSSIPEALRTVPGLHVARIDASRWAITSRGFNGLFANKLLVLMDGRSVYTQTFSGVYWDMQDTFLEDIDRIEIIRGPGATLWGANAVNGVINIITKSARDTQGNLVVLGGGTEELGFGGLRIGGSVDQNLHFRVYSKFAFRDDFVMPDGDDATDEWHTVRGGFRIDWSASPKDKLTFQGDISDTITGESEAQLPLTSPPERITQDSDLEGMNLLTRWEHSFSETSNFAFQFYFDRSKRESLLTNDNTDTYDVDFHHRFRWAANDFIWGLGYRYIKDEFDESFGVSWQPQERNYDIFSGFIQDNITIVPEKFILILGSKFEHHEFTDTEIQPNLRFQYFLQKHSMIWGAASKAVKTPSRSEHDIRTNTQPPIDVSVSGSPFTSLVRFQGSDNIESEDLSAYELGYRCQIGPRLSLDIATFYNEYENLISLEPNTPFVEFNPEPVHLVIPVDFDNKMRATTYGVEVAPVFQITSNWRVGASYSLLKMDADLDSDSRDTFSLTREGLTPVHQASLRSIANFFDSVELDIMIRYVDNVPTVDVDKYISLDCRLGWSFKSGLEFSIIGQSLLSDQHQEFAPEVFDSSETEIQHGVLAKITCPF